MARLEAVCKPEAIVSSNTSGIPIGEIAADCSDTFKARFLGTHFFNPPRYLKLLEIIPTADTAPHIIETMSAFGRDVLGKGVVLCKDTPNFIANRFGAVTGAYLAEKSLGMGFKVTDVDQLVGPLLGRPKTGYFRLADLVGLDIRTSVLENLYPAVPHDAYRELLKGEKSWAIYRQMLDSGWIGNKAGQGFYKKEMVDGQRRFKSLDTDSMIYGEYGESTFASVTAAQGIRPLVKRIKALLSGEDEAAELIRGVIFNMLEYAAYVAPEIAYSIQDIDNAVRWGFNHQMGPFELWDGLGVSDTAVMMAQHGHIVPSWVKDMMAQGVSNFYSEGSVYDFASGNMAAKKRDAKHVTVTQIAAQGEAIAQNESATLHDMGDRVLLLEFHTKVNALDVEIFKIGDIAIDQLESGAFKGMVVGNDGRHFSVGANLGKSAGTDWEATSARIKTGQTFMMRLQHAPKPVVTALHGRALGGGAEIAMQGWRSVAEHEMKIGLVEFNVGLVPAWTGCKELVRRRINPLAKAGASTESIENELRAILKTLMGAKVSSSAWEAKSMGYLREDDAIVMNPDHRLSVAKEIVLALVAEGRPSPEVEQIYAAGSSAEKSLLADLSAMEEAGKITAYDGVIGRKLARILCGGTSTAEWVDPWRLLDLEREASLAIRGNEKTKERIAHILKTGKPLRN